MLQYDELPDPAPGAGEALVRVDVAGVNFIDVYQRTGRYTGTLPFILGLEGAGVVERVGSGVTDVQVGDRVAWAMILGGYAERGRCRPSGSSRFRPA